MVNGLIIVNFKLYFLPPRHLSVADGGFISTRNTCIAKPRDARGWVGWERHEMTGMGWWERNGVNCVTGKLALILVGGMYLISF